MKQYEQDMTQGNLWKQIWVYSVPLMFTNLLQVLFNFADIAIVGRFGEAGAIGSVGSTTTLIGLFTGIVIGLSGGANVIVARARGEKDSAKTKEAVHTAAVIMLLAGLLLSVAGIVLAPNILSAMHTKPELLDNAILYFRIYFLGMPALALYNYGNAVLSSVGDTKRPLYFLAFAGAINVVLNFIFVVFFHMNVAGVALASVISQVVSAILVLRVLLKSDADYGLHIKELSVKKNVVGSILRIGLPTAAQFAIFQIANIFIQMGVNSFDAITVEGTAAAANAESLLYQMAAAFYAAGTTFISQNLGARKKERILKSYLVSQASATLLSFTLGLLLAIFGRHFLGFFTTNPAVIEAGMYRLKVMGFTCWLSTLMDGTIAASRGLGETVTPTIIVFLGSCVFRIVWIYTVFAFFGTITSLYLVYACSWSITAIAEIIYFTKLYRRKGATL